MSLSDNEEAPRGKKKGGGLGAFFTSTATADTARTQSHADWDETSRGGYSTVSKMFRAKVRRINKQQPGPDHENDEAKSRSYLNKLDGLRHRQHERTARREGIDSDEQSLEAHSTAGRLQRKSQTSSTVPSSLTVSLTSSLSNASSASTHTSSSASTHRQSNLHGQRSSAGASHVACTNSSNKNGATTSNSAKERSKSRCRAETRPRSSNTKELHLSSNRSTRGSANGKSSSMRKPMPCQSSSISSSSHSHSTHRRRPKSSSDVTAEPKRRESTESTAGKPLSAVMEKKNTRDGSSKPLQVTPGSDPVSSEHRPIKVSPEPATARKAIQFLPSTNAKPLVFPCAETMEHVKGKCNSGQNATPKQHHATTSNPPNKSSSKQGSGALSSSRHSRIHNSTTQSHRARDMDRDHHANNSRGPLQGGSSTSKRSVPEQKHAHVDSSLRSSSRRPCINADQSRSASHFTSEFEYSDSDSNLREHAKEGGGNGVAHDSSKPDPINYCFSSLSSESFPGEDIETELVAGVSSEKNISQPHPQASHRKVLGPGEAFVSKANSGSRPRSLDGKSVHGEAGVAGEETITRNGLPLIAKSAPETLHGIHSSSSSSSSSRAASAEAGSSGHNNTNKLTGTTDRGRRGSDHDESESHNSQSRQIANSQLKVEHPSPKADSVERHMAANVNASVWSTTTTTMTRTRTSKSVNTYCNADNGTICCEAECVDCVDKNGNYDDDDHKNDDDGAICEEPREMADKLKTSHLRRLVEPPRRVVRCGSHSSYSSAVGSLSSRDDSIQFRGLRKVIRTENELSSSSWRPPHRRKSTEHISGLEDERFEIDLNHQTKKTDSAPKTPRRRSSNAGSRRSSVSSYTSSYTKTSRRHSQESSVYHDGQDDFDCSESIIEEEGEESSSNPINMSDYGPVEDVFSYFSWSIAKQDADAIQRERKRIRDSILDTPFYQVYYKSSGISQCEIAT